MPAARPFAVTVGILLGLVPAARLGMRCRLRAPVTFGILLGCDAGCVRPFAVTFGILSGWVEPALHPSVSLPRIGCAAVVTLRLCSPADSSPNCAQPGIGLLVKVTESPMTHPLDAHA
jgi:hypothetical protein